MKRLVPFTSSPLDFYRGRCVKEADLFSPGSVEMSATRSFKEDKVLGDNGENTQLEPIGKHLNITLHKGKNSDRFDFKSACDNVYVELKTRTCAVGDYDTTIIPHSKIKFADENPQRTYYFCFFFTDGLYQIEYNKELFDTFEVKDFRRRQRIDFNDKVQKYCYIPVKHLKRISDPRLDGCKIEE